MKGESFAVGQSYTETFYGGRGSRNQFIADMQSRGWVLTNSQRVNNTTYRLTFRCDGL